MKYDRKILVVFSDTHGGHKKGLLNPETTTVQQTVDEKGRSSYDQTPVTVNPYQEYLWGVYEKNIAETFKMAGNDPVAVVHNGDLTQGVKYPDGLDQTDVASQMMVATSNMRPWFKHKNMKWFRLVWGTDSHIHGEGSAPRIVSSILQREYPKIDVQSMPHCLMEFGGLHHDIAHHGPADSSRSWLRGNTPRYYTKSIILDALKAGATIPDTIFRGHFHGRVEEWVIEWLGPKRQKTLYCMTPSYQGMYEYARMRSQSSPVSINGHVAIEIIDKKIHDVHWFANVVDVRKREVLE